MPKTPLQASTAITQQNQPTQCLGVLLSTRQLCLVGVRRYGCAYTGADAAFYEPSKELMKKMAYYYDIRTAPWAFIFDIDMTVRHVVHGLQFHSIAPRCSKDWMTMGITGLP